MLWVPDRFLEKCAKAVVEDYGAAAAMDTNAGVKKPILVDGRHRNDRLDKIIRRLAPTLQQNKTYNITVWGAPFSKPSLRNTVP